MFFLGTCVEKKTKEEEEWEKGKKYVGRKLVVKVLGWIEGKGVWLSNDGKVLEV